MVEKSMDLRAASNNGRVRRWLIVGWKPVAAAWRGFDGQESQSQRIVE